MPSDEEVGSVWPSGIFNHGFTSSLGFTFGALEFVWCLCVECGTSIKIIEELK